MLPIGVAGATDSPQPGAYASRLLLEHLVDHRRVARRRLSGIVLFVDIVDYTTLADDFARDSRTGAERLSGILNAYYGDVFDLIERRGGDVLRLEGDSVLALWPPDAHIEAVAAAASLQKLSGHWRPEFGVTLSHRVSLAAGPLTVLDVGSDDARFMLIAGSPIARIASFPRNRVAETVLVGNELAAHLSRMRYAVTPLSSECAAIAPTNGIPPSGTAHVPHARPSPDFDAVRPYLSGPIARRQQSDRSSRLAEFRTVCMMYVKLANIDAVDPAQEQLVRAMSAMQEVVRENRAVLFDLGIGDKGVVALVACGLPTYASDTDSARACRIAIRLFRALGEIGVAPAIGISTGRAFCGEVGNDLRREYLVTGSVMNYGSRLMQSANREIVVDEATRDGAAQYFRFSDARLTAIKGRAQPMAIYTLLADGQEQALSTSWHGRLHGRDREIGQIVRVLESRLDDFRSAIAIEGEAGAGKTRLLRQVVDVAAARGQRAIFAATSPVDANTAYYVWRTLLVELVRDAAGPPGAAPDRVRDRILDLLADDTELAKVGLLNDIAPLGFTETALAQQISGPARLTGITHLLSGLIRRVARDGTLVLVVDDAQWLDDPSAQLLRNVARQSRVLVILAGRPLDDQYSPTAAELAETAQTRIRLNRLDRDSIARIVSDVLAVREIPTRVRDYIQEQAEGLPFYAEQLALWLRDRREISTNGGICTVEVDAFSQPPQSRLDGVIVNRVDALHDATQFTVKVASTLGRTFDAPTLLAVHPDRPASEQLKSTLDTLVRAGILDNPGTSKHYAFRHIHIRDVVHESLPVAQRGELHARAAKVLEASFKDRLEPHLATLAEHFQQAGQLDRAVHYLEQAARLSLARFANREALKQLDQVDEIARGSTLQLSASQLGLLACMRADALHALSRFDEAGECYVASAALNQISIPSTPDGIKRGIRGEFWRQLLRRLGRRGSSHEGGDNDRHRIAAHIFTRLAEHAYFRGDEAMIMYGTLASLNHAEQVGSIREIVEGYGALAIGFGTSGLYRVADFYRRRSLTVALQQPDEDVQGMAHLFAAVYAFQAGRWLETHEHCDQGSAHFLRLGNEFRRQSCIVIQAYALFAQGKLAAAEAMLKRFGRDAEQIDNDAVKAWILAGLAAIDLFSGRPASSALSHLSLIGGKHHHHRAERLMRDALEAAARLWLGDEGRATLSANAALRNMQEAPPTTGIAYVSVCAVAELFLSLAERDGVRASGLVADGVTASTRAVICFARRTRACKPRAHLIRGRMHGVLGHRLVARWQYLQALRSAGALGMPFEVALAHLALSRSSTGGRSLERERIAESILNDLGIDPWLSGVRMLATSGPLDSRSGVSVQ